VKRKAYWGVYGGLTVLAAMYCGHCVTHVVFEHGGPEVMTFNSATSDAGS